MTPPTDDTIEVSIFGPGFGECILVHIGCGKWLVVDSCTNRVRRLPAALAYFEDLGLNPERCVEAILITHWHDDHVGGIAQIVEACPRAAVWCSDALRCTEFLELLDLKLKRTDLKFTNGVAQLRRVVDLRGTAINFALGNLVLMQGTLNAAGQIFPFEARALSPSQYENLLAKKTLAALIPHKGTTEGRIPDTNPNHAAVVLALWVGPNHVLLGSDLEEQGDERLGWSAVVLNKHRPDLKASIFKIPHHGSKNAHHPETWSQLTNQQRRVAALTPYNKGRGLPTPDDVSRIIGLTPLAYISATRASRKVRRRENAVQKLIAQSVVSMRRLPNSPGHIRLRKAIGSPDPNWGLELLHGADLLDKFV